jgi:hypothetical protein
MYLSILPKLNSQVGSNLLRFAGKLIRRGFTAASMENGSMETTAMIRLEDIGSLTDFNRNTKAHLRRLKRTGRPELLTVNGRAEVVVQNASAYQRLLKLVEKLKRSSSGRT